MGSRLKTWMGRLGKGVDKSNYLSSQVIFWLFVFIAFLWTADAIFRTLGMAPFGNVSLGIGKYVTICSPYFTAGIAMALGGQVRVTILTARLNERTQAWVELFAYFTFLVFALIFTYFFFQYAQYLQPGGQRMTEIEEVKVWHLFAACTVGFVLFSSQIIREIVKVAQRIASGGLAKGTKLYSQPYFIVPLFLALYGLSYWVFTLNVIAGLFAVMFVFMFTSVPLPAALGFIGVFGLFTYGGLAYLSSIPFMAFYFISDPSWTALPMFMLGGVLFSVGLATPLFRTIRAWVGWLPGGLAVATVWIAAVWGAIIGSMFACLTLLIYFCLPELDRDGFPREFTLPLLCAGTSVDTLIPPSISMVIIGLITGTSIGGCLMAGIFPGLLLAILFTIYVISWAVRKGKVRRFLPGWKERFASIPGAIVPLLAPVILIGGIISGLFTTTEASCGMVVYILLASLATRHIKGVRQINSYGPQLTRTLGYIFLAVALSGTVTKTLSYYQIPQAIAAWVIAAGLSKWGLFAFLMAFIFGLGCIGEAVIIMIVLLPILMPTVEAVGIHPYWLACFYALQVTLAGITPPIGGLAFLAANIIKVDPYFIFKGVWPWVVMILLCLTILFMFPAIATWLPLSLGFTP